MESLQAPPLTLTEAQRRLVWLTAAAIALTRLLALSRTLWDWDEVQFALAVREYDAADYRPHPPGFPLFIAAARLVGLLAPDDFRALQIVTAVGAMALFPLIVLLCRELRFSFATSYSGAVLSVFLPNVWFYGGTAFSDVPSLALTVAACALLLRGARERRALFAGALLLGLAAAIRPQALIVGFAPATVAVWIRRREWRDVAAAALIGAGVISAAYTGAALASSSVAEYLETGRRLRAYLREVDSFLAPGRPPLRVLAEFFFVRAIPGGTLARIVIAAGALGLPISLIRREGRPLLLVAMFLPFQLFAWLMLDYHSVTRYGVSFAPMYAILAAAAVVSTASLLPRGGRTAGAIVVMAFAAALARWTVPALSEVRRNPSPPVAAMEWINRAVPRQTTTYVHGSVIPYARYFLGERQMEIVESPRDIGSAPVSRDAMVVTELPSPALSASRFVRGRGRLFEIVRERYFEVTVIPAQAWAGFGEGWHDIEWHSEVVWLWMGRRSVTWLPPMEGPATLTLRFEPVPEKGPPVIEVQLNGQMIERFAASGLTEKKWNVTPRADGWNELVITADRAVNPAREGISGDARDLSLQLLGYDWAPAR